MKQQYPIGVFDSGFGGLTVLNSIIQSLPQYDYIYLGDNARTPYGNRSFETVYEYTREAVDWLFKNNCRLVILACNTASAKALRNIQQKDLLNYGPQHKVLGIIRPVTEAIDSYSKTKHVGILATQGTVNSESYIIEIKKFFPEMTVVQEACPIWVPLVETLEYKSTGADYFVKKHIDQLLKKDSLIDTIVLGCTHYPLLIDKIRKFVPEYIQIISQGSIVGNKLADYLERHPEIENLCSQNASVQFYTTDSSDSFNILASEFFEKEISSIKVALK